MAMQSICDSAFTEKNPGRGSVPRVLRRSSVAAVCCLYGKRSPISDSVPSLQTLEDRRDRQDMALVHKFLTEKSGTDMFRQMAATGRAGTRQAAGGHGQVSSTPGQIPESIPLQCGQLRNGTSCQMMSSQPLMGLSSGTR